ncbi:MAG: hypothetical protein O2910_00405, partial [Proteobacteria bacterium]|nr:hypothetical protein [Pseudomonadota bacterium]
TYASEDNTRQGFPIRSLIFLAAVGAVVVQYRLLDSYLLFWAFGVCLLGYALLRELRSGAVDGADAAFEAPSDGYANIGAFVAGTLMLVAFAVLARIYSLDDAFYATMTNGLLDHPELPALSRDTMFAGGTYPLLVPVFKAESLDALYAVLADFLNVDQSLKNSLGYSIERWILFAGLLAS